MTDNKRYLILGGGAAGTLLASELLKNISKGSIEITLVDVKDHHEYIPSIINVLLQPTEEEMQTRLKQICIPFEKLVGKGIKIIHSKVDKVTSNEVHLMNGEKLKFDKLFICTGSSYNLPYKSSDNVNNYEDRLNEIKEYKQKIIEAKKILCIGGGAVGVEMVGELLARYTDKEIILAHNQAKLLNNIPGDLSTNCVKALEELSSKNNNFKLLLDEKVERVDDNVYKLKNGELLIVDLVIASIGVQPNSDFIKEEMHDCLDDKGCIKINEYFEVEGYNNIYALGDVSNAKEAKLYFTAHMQAFHLAKNISLEINHHPKKPYRGTSILALISLGPDYALFSLFNGYITYNGVPIGICKSVPHASRLNSYFKYYIEVVSRNPFLATTVNQILFYTLTKWFSS